MALFQEVRLPWGGRDVVIAPDQVMRAIAMVEEVVTIDKVAKMVASRELKIAKLSEAVANAMRCAGESVTDAEVYAYLVRDNGTHLAVEAHQWAYRLLCMMAMMNPPEHLRAKSGKKPGKHEAASDRAASSPSATSSQ